MIHLRWLIAISPSTRCVLLTLIFATGMVLPLNSSVNAQDLFEKPSSNTGRKHADPQMQQYLEDARAYTGNITRAFRRMEQDEKNWEQTVPRQVIGHIKGKQGYELKIELPKLPEVLPKELIPSAPAFPDFDNKFRDGSLFENAEIPSCANSKAEFKKSNGAPQDRSETSVLIDNLYIDGLFFSDNGISRDIKELLGPEVLITKYDRGNTSVINGVIKAAGIPCLPYRIRVTTHGTFRLSGRDALKNFEGPESKGSFHPALAEVVRRLR